MSIRRAITRRNTVRRVADRCLLWLQELYISAYALSFSHANARRGAYSGMLVVLLLSGSYPAAARDGSTSADGTGADDVMFSALIDEMNRSKSSLRSESYPLPYFISYWVKEVDEIELSSCLGSEPDVSHVRTRILTPIVRLGNSDLDSSVPGTTRQHSVSQIQLDNDYSALRKSVWLATDKAYKYAIRTLEWKTAYLSKYRLPHRLPDFSEEKPVVSIKPTKQVTLDRNRWRETVQRLSSIFKSCKEIQSSKVSVIGRKVTNWYVDSEGTRIRDSRDLYAVRLSASTQAEDGMNIVDFDVAAGVEESQLPSDSALEKMVETFSTNLTAISKAPVGEEYCGPVLFKGQAAAEFFATVLAPNLGLACEYFGSETWRNPFKNAIGRKVLPEYISIVDDPKERDFKGVPLVGGYNFDDEGVPAQKVELVANGRLANFCQSRRPTHHSKKSNGHSMGGHGVFNLLEMKCSKSVSDAEMKDVYAELAKDAGLNYILVIEKIRDTYEMAECPSVGNTNRRYDTPAYSTRPGDPAIAYRLYMDGRKEYVRGLEFNTTSLRAFRDIQAVGDDTAPHMVEPSDSSARHLICPSYLIGELELRPVKSEHAARPVVDSPVSEAAGSQ